MNGHINHLRFCLVAAGLLCLVINGLAQERESKESTDTAAEEKARMARAARHMEQCVARLASDAEREIELIEQPLLTFGDSARANQNGSLWAFGKSGRPLAFLELYKGTQRTDRWVHAAMLTGKSLIVMKTPLGDQWRPEKLQIEPIAIAEAPAPEAKEAQRLRQLRELARRFAAHEFWDPDNSRFELRLLAQPVHRFSDPKGGIQDAAAFVLAHGTNPEVILLAEAIGQDLQTARWHYSLARVGSAEMHVEMNSKEVWKCGRAAGIVGSPTDPYWLFFSTSFESE